MYGMYGYPQPSYYDYIRQQMQPQQAAPQSNALPAQQVIQVAGRQSIDTLQMAPNSSVLIMDTSAPIVWLCVSDGLGKKAAEYKAEYRKLAEVLYELSSEEMSHIKRLHDEVARMIADYREKKGDPPADMLAVYEYLHKKHIEQVAEVKRYQDVYKSM